MVNLRKHHLKLSLDYLQSYLSSQNPADLETALSNLVQAKTKYIVPRQELSAEERVFEFKLEVMDTIHKYLLAKAEGKDKLAMTQQTLTRLMQLLDNSPVQQGAQQSVEDFLRSVTGLKDINQTKLSNCYAYLQAQYSEELVLLLNNSIQAIEATSELNEKEKIFRKTSNSLNISERSLKDFKVKSQEEETVFFKFLICVIDFEIKLLKQLLNFKDKKNSAKFNKKYEFIFSLLARLKHAKYDQVVRFYKMYNNIFLSLKKIDEKNLLNAINFIRHCVFSYEELCDGTEVDNKKEVSCSFEKLADYLYEKFCLFSTDFLNTKTTARNLIAMLRVIKRFYNLAEKNDPSQIALQSQVYLINEKIGDMYCLAILKYNLNDTVRDSHQKEAINYYQGCINFYRKIHDGSDEQTPIQKCCAIKALADIYYKISSIQKTLLERKTSLEYAKQSFNSLLNLNGADHNANVLYLRANNIIPSLLLQQTNFELMYNSTNLVQNKSALIGMITSYEDAISGVYAGTLERITLTEDSFTDDLYQAMTLNEQLSLFHQLKKSLEIDVNAAVDQKSSDSGYAMDSLLGQQYSQPLTPQSGIRSNHKRGRGSYNSEPSSSKERRIGVEQPSVKKIYITP